MDIQRYLGLVTSQHSTKPKFTAWLTAALGSIDGASSLAGGFNYYFDPDTAIGVQLDTLGTIVGVSRELPFQPSDNSSPVLGDEAYRLVLKARIARNQWSGTIPEIYDLWINVLPSLGLQIVDHQDMSITAKVTGSINELRQQLIANGYIVPKSVGVSINYESKTNMENGNTSSAVVASAVQAQNIMTHPPDPVTLSQGNSAITLSSALQSENEMIHPPDPITLDQRYSEMVISQAHTIVIK